MFWHRQTDDDVQTITDAYFVFFFINYSLAIAALIRINKYRPHGLPLIPIGVTLHLSSRNVTNTYGA